MTEPMQASAEAPLEDAAAAGLVDAGRKRRPLVLLARLSLSAAMLGILFWRMPHVSMDDLIPDWNRDTALFLAGAALLTLLGVVLSTLRWRTVLTALGQEAKLRTLLSHNLAGLFVSNVLPTTIGGDVLRVSRLSRQNGEAAASFASVALERLTGWLVLPLITLAIPRRWRSRSRRERSSRSCSS